MTITITSSDKPKSNPTSFINRNFIALLLSDVAHNNKITYAPKVIYPWSKKTSPTAPPFMQIVR